MRLALLLLVALAGCSSSFNDAGPLNGDDDYGAMQAQCAVASDCIAAAAKCCDCPTYAAPRNDPAVNACGGVTCPSGPACPMNVAPSCSTEHKCVLACVAMACSNTCEDGFVVDANGCLSCECAQVESRDCLADASCAEAPADCCGCARGGADTSVPADQLATYEAELGCPSNPACPGNSSCDASEAPSCVQGACALVPALPPNACGRSDLPACTTGFVCSVNVGGGDNPANDHRVGVCIEAS
jgi:Antistasin family